MHPKCSTRCLSPVMPLSSQDLGSDEEVVCNAGRDGLEQSCEQAREELTNSIRQQWRKLKHHVENLDSQGAHREAIFRKITQNWEENTFIKYYILPIIEKCVDQMKDKLMRLPIG